MKAALLLAPVALFLGFFFAFPLLEVFQAAFQGSDAWRWLADDYARSRLAIAFQQAGLSVLLTLAVALPMAWLHHARRIRGSRLLLSLHVAPFVMPVFVVVFGIQAVLGRNGWLEGATGLDLLGAVGPLGAVVIANAYYNIGMASRLLHAALERRPHRLEQVAATLGAPPRHRLLRVTAPLLLPPMLAVALLTFVFCFGSFGVVLYLGQGEVDSVETLLYDNLSGAFAHEDRGAVLALLQMAVQLTVLAVYFLLQRRAARLPAEVEREAPRAGPALTALAWVAAAAAVAPLLAVLTEGFKVGGVWSLGGWRTLLDSGADGHLSGFTVAGALRWSLSYAAASVALALLLTLLLAYGARRLGPLRRVAEAIATLPLGTSSLVLGFGFVLAYVGPPFFLQGSPLIVVIAHTLVAFPFTARVLLPALDGLDPRMEAAAATLGASPWARVLRVHVPLLRGPLAAAAGLAAALSLGDFGSSLLLMTDDTMGLSVWIDRHAGAHAFDPLARAQAKALAGLLMVVTLAVFLAFEAVRPHRRKA
ncbi:MAG TPA: ABC transporter permease subunit [Candidatus Thermoplasmatota archaeon]|nr:ABC transporter permease subunit [Candidatus Thermoplasmatota archaeon]